MKKSLFFVAAASALMLTACSSENDVVQNAPQSQEAAAQQAVGFDVYMPQAVTRAGAPEGVMTTDKLKFENTGFGVFAYYHDGSTYGGSSSPDFMYNQQVKWDAGWTYSPLKYWPNETLKDSQTDPATSTGTEDRLSFFAYAPYVATRTAGLNHKNTSFTAFGSGIDAWDTATPQDYGISAIKAENETGDPMVEWKFCTTNIDNYVDLLWGVAPNGMSYQSVNPDNPKTSDPGYVNKTPGLPLTDMLKPDKDQKMKFLFQHALSRIGLSVVSSIDQIAAGDDGNKFNKAQTRVLIENVELWGDFGIQGVLNLKNTTANIANWDYVNVTKSGSNSSSPLFTFDNGTDDGDGGDADNSLIADGLRYKVTKKTAVTGAADAGAALTAFGALDEGVLASEKVLLQTGPDEGKKVSSATPAFVYGKPYYKVDASGAYVIATTQMNADINLYTKDASDNYTQVRKAGAGKLSLDGSTTTKYYSVTFNATPVVVASANTGLTENKTYYKLSSGTYGENDAVYDNRITVPTSGAVYPTGTYYELESESLATIDPYGSGTYYEGVLPRYIMVIPSTPDTPTTVGVRIKYHVITYDANLNGYVSDVANTITKETTIQLESGKSYNLKLILGLTSVKLDAVVGDWQVGDDAEVWLPQNVD